MDLTKTNLKPMLIRKVNDISNAYGWERAEKPYMKEEDFVL